MKQSRTALRFTFTPILSSSNRVIVVVGLDDGERQIGLVVQQIVGVLGLASLYRFPSDDNPPLTR